MRLRPKERPKITWNEVRGGMTLKITRYDNLRSVAENRSRWNKLIRILSGLSAVMTMLTIALHLISKNFRDN